jgi:hypothetical protein
MCCRVEHAELPPACLAAIARSRSAAGYAPLDRESPRHGDRRLASSPALTSFWSFFRSPFWSRANASSFLPPSGSSFALLVVASMMYASSWAAAIPPGAARSRRAGDRLSAVGNSWECSSQSRGAHPAFAAQARGSCRLAGEGLRTAPKKLELLVSMFVYEGHTSDGRIP